jgi:hypothetical protein
MMARPSRRKPMRKDEPMDPLDALHESLFVFVDRAAE